MTINPGNTKNKYEQAMPLVDEGWWESVLAEEKQYAPRLKNPETPKLATQPRAESSLAVEPRRANWDTVRDLYANDRIVALKATARNRGGLLVEGDGIAGFVPCSHLIDLAGREHEEERDLTLEAYLGKTLTLKVIEYLPQDGRVVFSERAALAGTGKRTELFHDLQIGARVKGTVTNITRFGVFVDLGGAEGLIHISELSWGRVSHPDQIVRLGEGIEVQVMEISAERCRVALSLKRLLRNPWESAESDFPVNTIQPAVVTSVLSYGAFARLETGVEGLIHASEMPHDENQTPRDLLKEEDRITARVLHVDPAHQRIGLSLRLEP